MQAPRLAAHIGQTVTFRHRHTYAAPAGSILRGVVTGMETIPHGPYKGQLSYSIYSYDAEASYGMPAGTFEVVEGESVQQRITNLRYADFSHQEHLHGLGTWDATFAATPTTDGVREYFYHDQIELLRKQL